MKLPPGRVSPGHGNFPGRARVQRALHQPAIQPTLTIGPANDQFETEADKMATHVISMQEPASGSATPPPKDNPGISVDRQTPGRREGLGGQPNLEEIEENPPIPEGQKEPTVSTEEDVKIETLEPDDLDELEAGDIGGDEAPPAAPEIQPKAVEIGAKGGAAPADVSARVSNPVGGRPLPADVRGFMEPRFEADFSNVRLHDQAADQKTARGIGARAFTHKTHIWLGKGESVSDKRLMAHELTHVVQQSPAVRQKKVDQNLPPVSKSKPQAQRAGFSLPDWAVSFINAIPGFFLLTVLLGRNPITDERVERNAINILKGLAGLIPGVGPILDNLIKSGALQDAFTWLQENLEKRNLNMNRISQVFKQIRENFDWWHPIDSFTVPLKPLFKDIVDFGGALLVKLKGFVIKGFMRVAGPLVEKVWDVLTKAGDTLALIFEHPLDFAKNLIKSVVSGITLFVDNVVSHLKRGLMGWLFGAMKGLNIQIPKQLNLRGLISIAFQILELTYEKFRAILVKHLDPYGNRKVGIIEKAVEFISILIKEGFAGVWEKMLEYIENFKQIVIEGIKTWVTNQIVNKAIEWAISLSNPVGALIKLVMSIYNVIKTFIERFHQIVDFANSIFESIGRIARGDVSQAAKFIEQAIGRTIPLILAFLASILNITGITKSIRNIIKKLRAKVALAMNKVVGFVVKKTKKLWAKLLGKKNAKRTMPEGHFMVGQKQHRLFAKKAGKSAKMFVSSGAEKPVKEAASEVRGEAEKIPEGAGKEEAQKLASDLDTADKNTKEPVKKINPEATTGSSRRPSKETQNAINKSLGSINADGEKLKEKIGVETDNPNFLIRAKEAELGNGGPTGTTETRTGKETKETLKDKQKGGGLDPGELEVGSYSRMKSKFGHKSPGGGGAPKTPDHQPQHALLFGLRNIVVRTDGEDHKVFGTGAPSYSHSKGITLNMNRKLHEKTRTYGSRGRKTRDDALESIGVPRDMILSNKAAKKESNVITKVPEVDEKASADEKKKKAVQKIKLLVNTELEADQGVVQTLYANQNVESGKVSSALDKVKEENKKSTWGILF